VRGSSPRERTRYLPNFVDDRRLPPAPRAEQDTPEDAPLLLCLGRLHRNKGFDVAIAALGEVPEAWLWIAGDGPERAALEARAAAEGVAGRVRFLGWRADVPALFAAADLLVCSSRHEPLGNIVIEARTFIRNDTEVTSMEAAVRTGLMAAEALRADHAPDAPPVHIEPPMAVPERIRHLIDVVWPDDPMKARLECFAWFKSQYDSMRADG